MRPWRQYKNRRKPGCNREYLEKAITKYLSEGGKITKIERAESLNCNKKINPGFDSGEFVYVSCRPKTNLY